MQLDAWTTSGDASDKARRKRLSIGYAVGAATVTAALSLITLTAHGQVFQAEETIDVSLVEAPPTIDGPEPEVQPEPPKPVLKSPSKNRKVSMSTPTGVPGGTPSEADPNAKTPYDGDADDAFDGEGGGGGAPVQPKKPVVVAKKKEVAPPAFVFVSEREQTTLPVPVTQPRPAYPSDAKSEGVEGTVRVQFLVKADGTIGDVRVTSGDSRLSGAVVEAVKRWRYQPATFEGRPVAIWRTASFPFRLKS
ncbi:MAG: TonB family protein [Polyangiaceae bacterium]